MAKTKVQKQVYQILQDIIGCGMDKINDKANLRNDLYADDLDMCELVMSLKVDLGLPYISESESDKFIKVGDVVKFVSNRKNNGDSVGDE